MESITNSFTNALASTFSSYSGIPSDKVRKVIEDALNGDVSSIKNATSDNSSNNIYNFEIKKVSEEEIIKGAIESGIAVFLHGRSSEGKSARVKGIDPTCEIIYLRNATPESLNGKSVYKESTGEMIDIKPTWLKRLEEKCEKEPDRFHVVFFDELTNALPSIQGMAFNIVLDREVNGMWKLPDNARIVAAGNDMDDSLAANQLAEPLFNRFAHVYINTTPENWLKWATENNIHPAIVSYIAYKKREALRTKYNGEKPNADPRKWEMASKVLYATKKPEMLRALVGEEITKEFIAFCNQSVITLEDILNDNYDDLEVITANVGKMYATVSSLAQVDEEHVLKVRDFINQKFGKEYTATFDTLWAHGDEHRLETLQELQIGDVHDKAQKPAIGIDDVKLTLLSTEDIENEKYNTLKQYGKLAAITDLVIITGGYQKEFDKLRIPEDRSLKGRIAWQYTIPRSNIPYLRAMIDCINQDGQISTIYVDDKFEAIRPILTSPYIFSQVYPMLRQGDNGIYEVEFGEYTQYVPVDSIQTKLNDARKSNKLLETGRYFPSLGKANDRSSFPEYEYNGRKYVNLYSRQPWNRDFDIELSNGQIYGFLVPFWVEVSPITWLVDIETKTLISKRSLLSGVQFNDKEYDGNFENTEMYRFLNEHMKRDMFQGEKLFKQPEEKNVKKLVKVKK